MCPFDLAAYGVHKDRLDEAILHPGPLSDVQNVGEASSKREGEEMLPLLSQGSKRNSSNAISRDKKNDNKRLRDEAEIQSVELSTLIF